MLTRRQFARGSAAIVSNSLIGGRSGMGGPESFSTPLPIPTLIDAASQGNAVKLKVTSGQHAFIEGELTRTYGYSAPVFGPIIRLRRGDEVAMTVENALDVVTSVHILEHEDGGLMGQICMHLASNRDVRNAV
jgi:FtsP/CotA-like multicopper oxidase with cupredoxin domain